jgi:GTP-binding nuclear protein Ran
MLLCQLRQSEVPTIPHTPRSYKTMASTHHAKNTFKVVLLGDGGCGKTQLVLRALTGDYQSRYVVTLGVEVHPLRLRVRSGATGEVTNVCLNLWDTAGQEKFGGLADGYYLEADGAIVCAGVAQAPGASKLGIHNACIWRKAFFRVCPKAPVVLAILKCDKGETPGIRGEAKALSQKIDARSEHLVCSRTRLNVYAPFVALLAIFLKDPSLELVEGDPVAPPEVSQAVLAAAIYRAQLANALETPLSDEDE